MQDHRKRRFVANMLAPVTPRPAILGILLNMPLASKEAQLKHAWNDEDRSLNIEIMKYDELTIIRKTVQQSTDCIRGKVGFTKGLHVWEMHWPTGMRGTHAMVGVATKNFRLHCIGYCSLVGYDDQSWGWDLGRNQLHHNAMNNYIYAYPRLVDPSQGFPVPDEFLVVLDMDKGELSFMVDNQYLGVAFRKLRGKKLYPIVSAVWGNSKISMKFIGSLYNPWSLLDLCMPVVQRQLDKEGQTLSALNGLIPRTIIISMAENYRSRESSFSSENGESYV